MGPLENPVALPLGRIAVQSQLPAAPMTPVCHAALSELDLQQPAPALWPLPLPNHSQRDPANPRRITCSPPVVLPAFLPATNPTLLCMPAPSNLTLPSLLGLHRHFQYPPPTLGPLPSFPSTWDTPGQMSPWLVFNTCSDIIWAQGCRTCASPGGWSRRSCGYQFQGCPSAF